MIKSFERVKFKKIMSESSFSERKNVKENVESFIINLDKNNGNTYLTKSIINIYLLNPKEAKDALNKSKLYNLSLESEQILQTLDGFVSLLNLDLNQAYKKLS